jgi:transcriptional regulator with XRE-family HTH domain
VFAQDISLYSLNVDKKSVIIGFGKRVRELRVENKMTQENLAAKTGFHRTYIGMVERGERNISLANIVVFADAFGIPIAELMSFDLPSHKK